MSALLAWWRARTRRERWLVQGAVLLIVFGLVPLAAYRGAAAFRDAAAADLANAQRVSGQITQLAALQRTQGGQGAGGDGSLRERALAAATAVGLGAPRIEPVGADRIRVAFENIDSRAAYGWIAAMGRSGALVSRTAIVRVGESDLVNAEFEAAGQR